MVISNNLRKYLERMNAQGENCSMNFTGTDVKYYRIIKKMGLTDETFVSTFYFRLNNKAKELLK